MPEYDRSKAVKSGYAQVREALQSFAGDVVSAEEDKWGDGTEFLEINCTNIEILEVSEELSMEITEWNFRETCKLSENSFWMAKFLPSVDKHKLTLPDDLVGKRIVWKKVTLEATDKQGVRKPEFDSTNYIIDSVGAAFDTPSKVTAPPKVLAAQNQDNSPTDGEDTGGTADPMELALNLAVGKTETQFRSAISLHPQFVGSPLLSMAKSGVVTKQLVADGKLVEVQEGNKTVYQKPE